MKNTMKYFLLMVLFMSPVLWAQGTPKLELTIEESKVNLTPAEETGQTEIVYKPGDVIHYDIIVQNIGDADMADPVITDPVPDGVVYLPRSAEGEDAVISYSINGGNTYQSWPPTYRVTNADGEEVVRVAPPEMVTHIRWEMQKTFAPGEQEVLEFEVEVK